MDLQRKLAPVKARYDELAALMSETGLSSEDYVRLSTEYAELTPVIEAVKAYESAMHEKQELESLVHDPEMKDMAREELEALEAKIPRLEGIVKQALIPKDREDRKNAILEIRAGTGGDEAALFAADLFAMYQGFAATRGWSVDVMQATENDLGGYKEIVAEIRGQDVFADMKYESGVHRVQRVPKTESGGRIHTSAATVAILPEAEDVDFQIHDNDLRIDTFRSQGAGGQHVNTTDSAVRITHIPTGVVVSMQDEKSQHKNKDKAMKILRSRLLDAERQKVESARAAERKSQVGSGDRSERVRTYNYPQGRVSDHRVNLTLYKLEEVLQGQALDEIIDSLKTQDYADKLAELDI